ncbi:MAG: caspase family protein [Candidatus Cloacimonetes bacterium]|nr:caspase family protein [Candidatus Cloacimonadota bacterium]MDD2296360.1 caspase family protein [Sphaerochaetaceae bacterium]
MNKEFKLTLVIIGIFFLWVPILYAQVYTPASADTFEVLVYGRDKTTHEYGAYQYFRGKFYLRSGDTFFVPFNNLELIYPDSVSLRNTTVPSIYQEEYQHFTDDLLNQSLLDGSLILKSLAAATGVNQNHNQILQRYYYSYWFSFFRFLRCNDDYAVKFKKLVESNIEESLADEDLRNWLKLSRLLFGANFYQYRGQYDKALSALEEGLSLGIHQLSGLEEIIYTSSTVAMYLSTGEHRIPGLLSEIISSAHKNMADKTQDKINPYSWQGILSTEYLQLDLAISLNTELQKILEYYHAQISQLFSLYNQTYFSASHETEWYATLDSLYINKGFGDDLDLGYLITSYQGYADRYGHDDAELLEYLCYHVVYQVLHNDNYNVKRVNETIGYVESLVSSNPILGERTAFELVRHISMFMLDDAKKLDVDPPLVSLWEMPEETDASSVNVAGTVLDLSGVKSLHINEVEVQVSPDGIFRIPIALDIGQNAILLICEDNSGNVTRKETKVTRKSEVDLFRLRRNYAVIFAINEYENWAPLRSPVNDAVALKNELISNYGYKQDDVHLVLNPTYEEFHLWLIRLAEITYNKYDQLLVYYTGHGDFDEKLRQGYLVLKDTELPSNDLFRRTYLSLDLLKSSINRLDCENILFVVDACHSGTLDSNVIKKSEIKGIESGIKDRLKVEEYMRLKLSLRCRTYMTSVGNQLSVAGAEHSPFAEGILSALRTEGYQRGFLGISELWNTLKTIRTGYGDVVETGSLPQLGRIGEEDPGADFIFLYTPKN